MKSSKNSLLAAAALAVAVVSGALAHGGDKNVRLHVNPRWSECSFQLDPSLTQGAFRQFTQEGGLVTYFRPLIDARPMGAGKYEFSIVQWKTGINDADAAWNDTFVHPDSAHWLFEGSGLSFPGLTVRAGITDRIDLGIYFTRNPNANYGFVGGQLAYSLIDDRANNLAGTVRGSVVTMFGPEDVGMTVFGLDLLASREYTLFSDWLVASPYAGASAYLVTGRETSAVVDLKSERVAGIQGMAGITLRASLVQLSAEYNVAKVNTLSFKIGVSI